MSTSTFYLKDAKAKSKTAIVLSFSYSGNRLRIPTNKSINPDLWNKSKKRAKTNGYPENADINDALDEMATTMNSVYNEFVRNNVDPSKKQLKKAYEQKLHNDRNTPITIKKSFWNVFDQFVEYKKATVSKDVVKDYNNSLRKHWLQVEPQLGRKLRFTDFLDRPNGFVEKFDFYLTNIAINSKGEKGLMPNTIGKQFKNTKAFLNYCFDKQIIEPFSLKHMVTVAEETYKVFLTKEELERIQGLEIENQELNKARDLFIVACHIGLRYGDLISLKPVHIQADEIEITMNKTTKKVTIPINTVVRAILNKYNNNLPKPNSITEFNNNIRTIAELADINQEIEIVHKYGNRKVTEVVKKFELISSHTARRSFCTNLFLAGMPSEAIMVFSGHKSSASFMRYLKIDSKIATKKYKAEFFK
jgi:integrase